MVGFREAKFTPEGFFLNGEKVKLIGFNRHQNYPYVGCAMPDSAQREDADILKMKSAATSSAPPTTPIRKLSLPLR
jgi:beta-galactosidase/beta-glucuronidase